MGRSGSLESTLLPQSQLFAQFWAALRLVGALHNVLNKEKILAEQWDDLKIAMKLHGDAYFFVRTTANKAEDYLSRFGLALG
jgi:hypothetical protein